MRGAVVNNASKCYCQSSRFSAERLAKNFAAACRIRGRQLRRASAMFSPRPPLYCRWHACRCDDIVLVRLFYGSWDCRRCNTGNPSPLQPRQTLGVSHDAPNISHNSQNSQNSHNSQTGVAHLYMRAAVVIKHFFAAALYSWEWLLQVQQIFAAVLSVMALHFVVNHHCGLLLLVLPLKHQCLR